MVTDEILKEQFNNLVQQTIQEEDLLAKSPDFFEDNNAVVKKAKTVHDNENQIEKFFIKHCL